MAEFGLGTGLNVTFHLCPIAFIIFDFFAGGTGRKQSGQCLDLAESILKVGNHLVPFGPVSLTLGNLDRLLRRPCSDPLFQRLVYLLQFLSDPEEGAEHIIKNHGICQTTLHMPEPPVLRPKRRERTLNCR